jgi:hypothetical protein
MGESPLERGDAGRLLIGPGMVGDDEPGRLMDEARRRVRDAEDEDREGTLTARRLMVAFALSALLAVFSFVLLPKWGVYLPPMIPALGFIVILVGSILGSREDRAGDEQVVEKNSCGCDDEGRPICCGGPRPLRSFRDDS